MRKIIALVVLAGCSAAVQTLPPEAEDTCNAAAYAPLIGQQATALERVLLLGQVRVIRPDDMVTQDFRPSRINFMISADETIRTISCG